METPRGDQGAPTPSPSPKLTALFLKGIDLMLVGCEAVGVEKIPLDLATVRTLLRIALRAYELEPGRLAHEWDFHYTTSEKLRALADALEGK